MSLFQPKNLQRAGKNAVKCFFVLAILLHAAPAFALDVDKLSDADITMAKQVTAQLEPLIQKRDSEGTLSTLTFDELYEPLSKKEKKFIKQFRKLGRKETGIKIPWRGLSSGHEDLVRIRGQKVKEKIRTKQKDGKIKTVWVDRTLPPQFLPRHVHVKYLEMMTEMERDIGKRLYVDSGYRSSAFQLYLFIYYLRNHGYSIKETVRFVTLPGYSEHGAPEHQAIDFINANGINGDPNVKEFEVLPEFKWLNANAHRFGFVLSYPKDSPTGITYEPWHWRYDPKAATKVATRMNENGKRKN